MKKVVITGAAGFVGSALTKKLLSKNIEVFAIDMKEAIGIESPLLHYYSCNIFESKTIKNILKNIKDINVFYHLAWKGSAGPLRNDENCQIENALCAVSMYKIADEIGCNKFVFAGTIAEFETNVAIYEQNTRPQLSYIYGAGKILAHNLLKPISNSLNTKLVWAYITNAYGEGEKSPRLINTTINKCIDGVAPIFSSGTQNYDFVYIDDVANAFYLIGKKGLENKGYIIGSGKAQPLKNFLVELVSTCNPKLKPIFGAVPFTGVNLPLSYFSTDEIKKDCGFEAKISFKEGIKRTYNWLLKERK